VVARHEFQKFSYHRVGVDVSSTDLRFIGGDSSSVGRSRLATNALGMVLRIFGEGAWLDPTCPEQPVVYEIMECESAEKNIRGGLAVEGTYYQTLMNPGKELSDHVSAFMALAECNRMALVTSMRMNYASLKIRYFYYNDSVYPYAMKTEPAMGRRKKMKKKKATMDRTLITKTNAYGVGFIISRELQKCYFRIFLTGLLENTLHLHLQVFRFSLEHHLTGTLSVESIVCLATSIISLTLRLFDAWTAVGWFRKTLNQYSHYLPPAFVGKLWPRVYLFECGCALYLLAGLDGLYALGGIFYCSSSMVSGLSCIQP